MDEQRDYNEEMDNAMIPYRENMTQIAGPKWTPDTLISFVVNNGADIARNPWNRLFLNTKIEEAPDGSLWINPEDFPEGFTAPTGRESGQ